MEQTILHVHFVPDLETGEVSPFSPQYGGVQGDRNVATVSFAVPESLQGDRFRYRIEGEDGAGGFVTTALLPLDDDGNVATLLDEQFTAAGGQILVRLVVSELQNNNEIATVHSFDGRLFFADAPVQHSSSPFRNTLSALVERADKQFVEMGELAEEVTEKIGDFNARVGASEGMLSTHGRRLTALESALDAADERMDDFNARAGASEGMLSTHGTRLTTLENALDAADERMDEFNARAGASEGMLSTHGTRLTALENALDAADERMDALDDRDEESEEALSAHGTRLTALENALTTVETKEDEPTPWKFIQKIVRAGLASKVFAVGDEFVTEHSVYGDIVWEVVGFDHYSLVDDRFSHSMTLQAKHCLHAANGQYDLKVFNTPNTTYTSGFADWGTSTLRAWLNSDAAAGNWFVSGGNGAETPDYAAQDGFMRGFGESFLGAIGTVKTPVALNSTYSTHSGTSNDKFFLPSRVELYAGIATGNTGAYEGEILERYGESHSDLSAPGSTVDANRIKKLNGTAVAWWTRSVNPLTSNKAVQIKVDGAIYSLVPNSACAVAPMCCIY